MIADGALLLAGIVPGVVAFIVDFGTGAWNHDNLADNEPDTKPDYAMIH